jgi:glycine betaine/proline transport system substrate-binding protein
MTGRLTMKTGFKSSLSLPFAAALLFAGTGLAQAAEEKPGAGVTVKLARATWDTGWFPAEVYKQMLEELGYEIRRVSTLDNPAFYQSVGQGDMDLWVNGWFPLHNTYEEAFQKGGEKVGYVARGGALQGYLVDKKTANELNITNLEDFKRDEVKKRFDHDEDGKAEMVACPPGWGCEVTISYHLEAYGLEDHVEPIKASYSASMADALGRYKNGQSVFFYTWTPNWTVGLMQPGEDVVWITVNETKLPPEQEQFADATTVEGLEGCVKDPCNLGWPANDIRPVANTEFLEANPAVRRLLEVASIPIGDIYEQNAKMQQDGEDSKADIQRHASEWIEDNRNRVDRWLRSARRAAES